MFFRLIRQSFLRQRRRKLLAGVSIALGVTVATAMIAVATNIGDRINHELRSYGANIIVRPQTDTLEVRIGSVNLKPVSDGSFLQESQLGAIKGIFWQNNILAFAPFLPVSVNIAAPSGSLQRVELDGTYFAKTVSWGKETFVTGVRKLNPWWKVEGSWPSDDRDEVLVGRSLAKRLQLNPGDRVQIGGRTAIVSGLLTTGGKEDEQIVGPLRMAQLIGGQPGAVRTIQVGALTKPEDEFGRRNPDTMSPSDKDRWYCSPYARSIAYQLQETIPNSRADVVLQVANNEGAVLSRIKGLMMLVTLASLLASALAVSAAMAAAIIERRPEVGLMKALGAGSGPIAALFFTEAAVLAMAGGMAGFLLGSILARGIGLWIFQTATGISPVLLPLILGVAVLVAFAGSAGAIRKAVRFEPVTALKGDA